MSEQPPTPPRGTVAMVMPRTGPTLLFAPYNYMALATDLKARGYNPVYLDNRLVDARVRLRELAASGELRAVLLTSMMGPQLGYALQLGLWVREQLPGVPTIWGGILPTELPLQTIRHPAVSYVIRGWGEGRLPDLLDALTDGADLGSIAGLVYNEEGSPVENPWDARSEHPPLVYDYDVVDLKPFLLDGYGLGERSLVMITTRGCPHHCTFCYGPQFHGSSWSAQSAEQVLADVDRLSARYDFDSIFFNDDNFAPKWKRVEAIAEGLAKRGLGYGISFHASYLNEDRIRMLAQTGCKRLYWGPESGSPRMLEIMQKGATVEMNLEIAHAAGRHGLGALMGFMVGHPEEREVDLLLTLNHIDELMRIHPGLDISDIKIFTPYPGTRFYEEALQHGFAPPQQIEEWATYAWNKAHLPWLSPAQRRRLEVISYASLCAFATWRTKGLNPLQNGVVDVLHRVEGWRWRNRRFGFAPELRLLQTYVELHSADGNLKSRAWNRLRGLADRAKLR